MKNKYRNRALNKPPAYADILGARHAIFLPNECRRGRLRDEPKERLRRRLRLTAYKKILRQRQMSYTKNTQQIVEKYFFFYWVQNSFRMRVQNKCDSHRDGTKETLQINTWCTKIAVIWNASWYNYNIIMIHTYIKVLKMIFINLIFFWLFPQKRIFKHLFSWDKILFRWLKIQTKWTGWLFCKL